jgi:hypothetical protein
MLLLSTFQAFAILIFPFFNSSKYLTLMVDNNESAINEFVWKIGVEND